MKKILNYLRKMGGTLMNPIAVLPAASLLLGIGYAMDPSGWGGNNLLAQILVTSGDAILGMLGMLFAVGISYGMTKDKNGAAALSGVLGYTLLIKLLNPSFVSRFIGELSEVQTMAFNKADGAFVGIIVGIIVSVIYNKFHKVELPKALSFFSGRRSVPILTAGAMILLSFVLMFVWPVVFGALVKFGMSIQSLGAVGAALYGFFNRLLIPVGLHHALNAVFWFDTAGINDLANFWAGTGVKGVTGMYMAGFFPIMMFGLVGAALAFIKTAKPEHKNRVIGLMTAGAVAAFVTGVTEPIEFAFMFAAPALYVVHAGLTAISMFIAATMKWTAGFGFSAGAIDWVLSSRVPLANKPYMLLVMGVIFAALYYFIFTFAIKKFNLKTPGREDDVQVESVPTENNTKSSNVDAKGYIQALGGSDNLVEIDNCITRLRLDVKDASALDEAELKRLGAKGVMKLNDESVQVIVGTEVESVANAIKGELSC